MERLTFGGNFCDIAQCRDTLCRNDGTCTQKEVWERLKQFEDAFGTPETAERVKLAFMGKAVYEIKEFGGVPLARLIELAEADKDGRLVALPCKVGDMVYFVNAKHILEFTVVGYAVDETGISWVYSEHVDKTGNTYERTFSPDRIGKTTFLSREEAEKAMKGETEK